jgi:H+-translocating NAD(P) transhydrogenase subunit alpha
MLNPFDRAGLERLAKAQVTAFAMEAAPRTTRAQSMDVLSSQANLAGYKAVMLAANAYPKIFPMLMTAAGTIKAARVVILGAGVAGLQAIATAKRLGAVVEASDVRPAVKEQIESLGGQVY